ncbi:hypothetical protein CDAR_66991 [Caerostris darwini]|uniref:Uncharacterized protein n=1 Tax=Caerostris darwini TaxID=1538125 RepID=A0AAV4QYV6_9ARAC|nr:hypothetical protein CDAR_66991 [Caerostris darwini]
MSTKYEISFFQKVTTTDLDEDFTKYLMENAYAPFRHILIPLSNSLPQPLPPAHLIFTNHLGRKSVRSVKLQESERSYAIKNAGKEKSKKRKKASRSDLSSRNASLRR